MRLADWQAYREQFKNDVLETEARLNQAGLYTYIDEALLNSRAFLFVSDHGWAVFQPISVKGIPSVHILFVKSYKPGILTRHTIFAVKMAKRIGSRYLTADTKSKRAMMAYRRFGFKLESESDGVYHLKKIL